MSFFIRCFVGFALVAVPVSVRAAAVFTSGSPWKYLVGTVEASTPATLWRAGGFNDGAWAGGSSPVGYGEPEVATTLPTGTAGGYTTVYLRKTFTVPNAATVTQLELTMAIDDGVVVWLNGIEIGRTNSPTGEVPFNAVATAAPTQWYTNIVVLNTFSTPPLASVLLPGENVLAVHLLNGSQGSSDLFFDASLAALEPDLSYPMVASVVPAPGATVNGLTQLTVTFSEPVAGVDAADLRVNGIAATEVTGAGATYTFAFGQPAQGTVSITWAPNHGIYDLGVPPNPFNPAAPGNTWNYTVVDLTPPAIAALVPPIGATVTSLGQIQVTFNEPVKGVDAVDLTINGAPASEVTALSPSQYSFQFPPAAAGPVNVAWAAGHGITDLAPTPNPFGGGSWTYEVNPQARVEVVLITEFMASNTRTLADEDGEFSDWIEVHNPGLAAVGLEGWYLTDDPGNLRKWMFPATNLNAGAYLVVFASNKDRRVPGRPLHTNFRLDGGGEYLALVEPNGTNVMSQFAPFPAQVADVSFGLSQSISESVLVAGNAAARVRVPTDGSLGQTWIAPDFADAAWTPAVNGIGFDSVPGEPGETPYGALIATDIGAAMRNQNGSAFIRIPFQVTDPTRISSLTLGMRYDDGFAAYLNGAPVVNRNAPVSGLVADSVADFSGVQGQGGWFYGYYNLTSDANGTYQANDFVPFPSDAGPNSASNFWTGAIWDWFAGNPPWTELNPQGGHPNGNNNGNVHWAVRRWQSDVQGTIRLSVRHAKSNTGGGNGTTARVFRNGTPVWTNTVAGTDGTGVATSLEIPGVQMGDFIDFAIDSLGTDGTRADGSDGTTLTALIEYLAPELAWNSVATVTRSNALGREIENIELSNASRWLAAGPNVLAIQALNAHATNADLFIQAQLTALVPLPLTQGTPRYFSGPTPGAANSAGTANLGPIIADAAHAPAQPLDDQDLFVTARIVPSFAPVVSNALVYRVMFGAEVRVPMLDDGLHGDGAAGDGIHGAVIPASAATSNQMVRWFISSTDAAGRASRWPIFSDPVRTPQYLGTVVADSGLTNPLPVVHWFLQNVAGADLDAGTRCAVYFLGRFYDNIFVNIHGQSSRGFPKKSYDLEFNPGYKFTYRAGAAPVSDVNFLTTYPDKAHMRNRLAYDAFEALGAPYHWVEPVRVHRNGSFYGTAHLVENGDDEFIERLGLNPQNPLYKMYNTFTTSPGHAAISAGGVEKKSRKFEDSSDLLALLNGMVQLAGEPRRVFMYDNLDLPQMLNSMAIRALIGEQDCCHKNYYLYRDTLGDREWEIWPWDVDLSYGRRWIGATTYWDDQMILDTRMPVGDNNGLLQALYTTSETREMYWRRQRTLLDEFLQAPGTPAGQLRLERRIDELARLVAPDAAEDLARWGTWCCGNGGPFTFATIPVKTNYQTLQQAVDLMKFGYLPQRRTFLFTNLAGGQMPPAQPADARVLIAGFEVSPASGNQAEEYVVVTNVNNYAVDISGWHVDGAIEHTFKPGTVIPTGGRLYLSPDVNAFRARTTGPRGGQALFVQGNYRGSLSARGETIRILNKSGYLMDAWSYPGNPGAAQRALRVTEIMYHPAAPATGTNDADRYEFIELKNVGPDALNLNGVRFTDGIVFNFTGSAVTGLAPGASVVIVRDLAAYAQRYGAPPAGAVAGQYAGALDNGGERLRLVDAAGEEILDFSFNNSWYPITDGLGFSLVVVDEQAAPDAWDHREQWRPGGSHHGTPAAGESAEAGPVVLITEALTRSDIPPPTDSIELHNPGAAPVDISGWFLTDDFKSPRKFQVPADTVLPPGGYRVFDESSFNPGGAGFALGSDGDEVWLFGARPDGTLNGYVHGFSFGAAENGVTFGRHVTTEGREHFVAQSAATLGSANAGPRVGPVVVTEIHYRPVDRIVIRGLNLPESADNSADEFIEIANISNASIDLFDEAVPDGAWRLAGGVDFVFPDKVTLGPGELVLVVNFPPTDPAVLELFRARYNVPAGVRLFGPFGGRLNNDSDDVILRRPISSGGTNLVQVTVDRVDYRDAAPWPAGADGLGYSLQRWNPAMFGNEPANWVATSPTPGAFTPTSGVPARFVTEPPSQLLPTGRPATLTAAAVGTAPIYYQWTFNGRALPDATNASLILPNVGQLDAGTYQIIAYNAFGVAVSGQTVLDVHLPPTIGQHPTNVLVRVQPDPSAASETNATFRVAAFSRSPLYYQWRFSGIDIPGAVGSSITVTNVRTNSLGWVTVVVSDGVSSVESQPAWLYPLVRPQILQTPASQDVAVGGRVTLGIEYSGWPPPYAVEWRLGSLPLITNQENSTIGFFSFTAPATVVTQQYRAVVKNLALPSGAPSSFARIVTLPDGDGDGLPDAWETVHGFNPAGGADRLLDPDGDGQRNWQEYQAGTDPNDASSFLKIDSISIRPGVRLEFGAVSNRTYRVQYNDLADSGVWQRLTDVLARTTNHTEIIVDPSAGTNRFYRVLTPAQ